MAGETILIADRNRRFLEKSEEILRRAGYRPVTARDGGEAIDLVRDEEPAVVLAGVSLPGRSGFQLCRYVKMDYDATVPCVLLFRADEKVQKAESTEAGAENWLVRPLKRTELLACVRDMLTIRKLKQRIVALRTASGESTADLTRGAEAAAGALFDADTGFYTFKAFKEILYREVKRARRHGFPLSIALIAFDPGDTFPGDASEGEARAQVFGGLATAVRESLRDTDLPVSYTGDNVLVLMPHTELAGAVTVAKRIQHRINKSTLRVAGREAHPTVSVGLASTASLGEGGFGELVKSASRSLQGAVRAGGNRILFEASVAEAVS